MISAFANIFKVPELRDRILFTLAMVIIVRLGVAVTIPGVDAGVIDEWLAPFAAQRYLTHYDYLHHLIGVKIQVGLMPDCKNYSVSSLQSLFQIWFDAQSHQFILVAEKSF